jgi:Lon protease-like protein
MWMGEAIPRLPLFPLGLVLLPAEVVPLHIFEERYKLMIGECLERRSEFGVLWMAEGGLRDVGCTARVTQLLERMEDGRMNILVQGADPFRLVHRIEDLPYPAGDVELLDEDEDDDPSEPAAGAGAREQYADLVERVTDSRPDPEALGQLDAYGMAATLEIAPAAKQSLLELRSEAGRLERLSELFTATMARLEHAERAAERARGNGQMR